MHTVSAIIAASQPPKAAAMAEEAGVTLCMECGCCSFVCPAGRPLVENNRLGKAKFKAHLAANPVAVKNSKE